jgi:hypothetical protein
MDFQTAQNDVVQRVAGDFGAADWVHAVVDLEVLEFEDGYDLDYQAILITRASGGALASQQFQLTEPTRQAVIALYRERKDNAGDVLGGFVLRIDHPGRYKFDLNYDPPKRLNGVWDAERQAYFDNYLTHYQRETAAGGAI